MSKFIIQGGGRLKGRVRAQGSKNAAFPVIAATILAPGQFVIDNVPEITDVESFLAIYKYLGGRWERRGHVLFLDSRKTRNRPLRRPMMEKLRGSVLYAGALLGRFGKVEFAFPGGDAIGARPIDVHLDGFQRLGASSRQQRGGNFTVRGPRLRGADIVLSFTSVTGTENLILAAVFARGRTTIKLAAAEPHVQNLCRFLHKLGARITGIGTSMLTIRGVARLKTKASHKLCPDEIAAMTYAAAAAATRGAVTIDGVDLRYLDAPLAMLSRMGVKFAARGGKIIVRGPNKPYLPARIITGVYPQLLTDFQPLLGVLATQARGESSVHDWIYEGRQGYLAALRKMGAKVVLEDRHRAKITGPAQLRGARITTPDIRAGASILIAALIAKGRSVIYNAEIIDRGYEHIDERLRDLGAKIERVN